MRAVSQKRCGNKTKIFTLTSLLITCPEGFLVDHKNRNSLDNRKSNFRIATRSQNQYNSGPRRGKKYKGVGFRRKSCNWIAKLMANGVNYCETHPTEILAAHAYDDLAIKHHGEFAYLNFPPKGVKK